MFMDYLGFIVLCSHSMFIKFKSYQGQQVSLKQSNVNRLHFVFWAKLAGNLGGGVTIEDQNFLIIWHQSIGFIFMANSRIDSIFLSCKLLVLVLSFILSVLVFSLIVLHIFILLQSYYFLYFQKKFMKKSKRKKKKKNKEVEKKNCSCNYKKTNCD